MSLALFGAVVLAKVVLVPEHVPLGAWIKARPAFVEVILRTALYALGVLLVLLGEKAFEGQHEHGGFGPSLVRYSNMQRFTLCGRMRFACPARCWCTTP